MKEHVKVPCPLEYLVIHSSTQTGSYMYLQEKKRGGGEEGRGGGGEEGRKGGGEEGRIVTPVFLVEGGGGRGLGCC